ncbi:acyl-CoA dehydrogenase, partial [Achromobacter sp. Marseille-Q0513]|uniref:acyl-CoA dehydrogenase family protein n=1 Tax=Achromobacter sp. Marseille-Q0513 TaxID=2829161 RepID=UPI001B9B7894
RIHHCMRSIGAAELALELMVDRAKSRSAFGKALNMHGSVGEWIARSRIEIDQARLLVLKAAWMLDKVGAKAARKEISMIKALVPSVHTAVCDRAMQGFGAMGGSPD